MSVRRSYKRQVVFPDELDLTPTLLRTAERRARQLASSSWRYPTERCWGFDRHGGQVEGSTVADVLADVDLDILERFVIDFSSKTDDGQPLGIALQFEPYNNYGHVVSVYEDEAVSIAALLSDMLETERKKFLKEHGQNDERQDVTDEDLPEPFWEEDTTPWYHDPPWVVKMLGSMLVLVVAGIVLAVLGLS